MTLQSHDWATFLFSTKISIIEMKEHLQYHADTETNLFFADLHPQKAHLFIDWIKEDAGLVEIVQKGHTLIPFSDRLKRRQHALFADFQKFISPFLFETLVKAAQRDILCPTVGYVCLLKPKEQTQIEKIIHLSVDRTLNVLFSKNINSQEYAQVVQTQINTNVIELYNKFSPFSYIYRMQYVEKCLSLTQQKKCKQKNTRWILNHLFLMELNPEHRDQLELFNQSHNQAHWITLISDKITYKYLLLALILLILFIFLIRMLFFFVQNN